MMASPEVLCRIEGRVGRITLNRPSAIHALTTGMIVAMTDALLAWREDHAIKLVMFDHSGERGFCAGGDIRMLAESGAGDGRAARDFFFREYQLNDLIFRYPKPTLAIMDGITMGGGWHLSRMPDHLGLWLALTGARIKAADCELVGVATDFIPCSEIPRLVAGVIADPANVETLLTELEGDAGRPPIAEHQDEIARAFGADSVEGIVGALKATDTDWARGQLATLATKSPQTLKVAFRQLRLGGACASFADNMAMEYRIGARVVQRHDFLEGVRAVIVDKDNAPRWDPPTLEAVDDALLDAIFARLPSSEEWTPLP